MDQLQSIALALIPSVGIGFLFYKVIRLILEGDRKERLAHSRWEARETVGANTGAAAGHGSLPAPDAASSEPGSR